MGAESGSFSAGDDELKGGPMKGGPKGGVVLADPGKGKMGGKFGGKMDGKMGGKF